MHLFLFIGFHSSGNIILVDLTGILNSNYMLLNGGRGWVGKGREKGFTSTYVKGATGSIPVQEDGGGGGIVHLLLNLPILLHSLPTLQVPTLQVSTLKGKLKRCKSREWAATSDEVLLEEIKTYKVI